MKNGDNSGKISLFLHHVNLERYRVANMGNEFAYVSYKDFEMSFLCVDEHGCHFLEKIT